MTGTARDALAVARRNLGYTEGPRDNENIFANDVPHPNFQPWCATFVLACLKAAGVPLPTPPSAYTPTLAQAYRDAGRWHATGKVGDLAFFRWPSMGRIAHVGLVEQVRPHGTYLVLEGNTDSAGGRTGGRVMRQVRKANIAGFGRPPYKPAPARPKTKADPVLKRGSKGQAVLNAQNALRRAGLRVAVDGDFGPGTDSALRAFQKAQGLPVDGIVQAADWAALRKVAHR